MSPNLRRAAHQALDLILDALAAESEQTKPVRRRGPSIATPPPPQRPLTPEEETELESRLAKAGYRRTG